MAAAHPEVVKVLRAAWSAWNAGMVEPLWGPHGKPKIPVNGETVEWYI